MLHEASSGTGTLFVAVVSGMLLGVVAMLVIIRGIAGPDTAANPLNWVSSIIYHIFIILGLFLLFCLLPTSKFHRHKSILGVPMTHLFLLLQHPLATMSVPPYPQSFPKFFFPENYVKMSHPLLNSPPTSPSLCRN